MQQAKRIKLTVSVLLTSLLVVILSSFYWQENKAVPQKNIRQEEKKDIKYSRLSFFNSSSARASLAIPDDWEGNYRLKENNDEASFFFINYVGEEIEMFSIKKAVYAGTENERVLCQANGYVFLYINKFNTSQDEKYLEMKDGVDALINSLKCK